MPAGFISSVFLSSCFPSCHRPPAALRTPPPHFRERPDSPLPSLSLDYALLHVPPRAGGRMCLVQTVCCESDVRLHSPARRRRVWACNASFSLNILDFVCRFISTGTEDYYIPSLPLSPHKWGRLVAVGTSFAGVVLTRACMCRCACPLVFTSGGEGCLRRGFQERC